jgi:hypothetical protein
MKMTHFSKTISTIGLMAALSVVVGSSIPKTAQAQSRSSIETQFQSKAEEIDEQACLAAYPQDQVFEDGSAFFDDGQGIEFSADQLATLERTGAVIEQRLQSIEDSAERIVGSNAVLSIAYYKEGLELTDEILQAVDLAILEADDATSTTSEQAAMLNQNVESSQYAEFSATESLVYTPEQEARRIQVLRDRNANFLAILTPEQQQQYQKNIEIRKRLNEACGIDVNGGFYLFD